MMEIKVKNVITGEKSFQVIPFTGREVTHLDRKVMKFTHGYGVAKAQDPSLKFTKFMFDYFADMDETEFDKLVYDSLKNTTFVGEKDGEKGRRLDDVDYVSNLFHGAIDEEYDLIIKVWEANELSPFAKRTGNSTSETA